MNRRKERTYMGLESVASRVDPLQFKCKIHFSLDRQGGERKPFILRSEGPLNLELKLSSIRAAIFLVLLLDLQDRLEGGSGIKNILDKVIEFYCALDPDALNTSNIKSVTRVGLYRFEFFLEEIKAAASSKVALIFKSTRPSLELQAADYKSAEILVTSTDQSILLLLEQSSKISPLARLRKYKSMYVPTGASGWDQLFLEFYDHKYKVRNTSLFYRLALPTHPDSLLRIIGASEATIKRKKVMLEGYKTGRTELIEILTRDTLWDLITLTDDSSFKLYPKQVTAGNIIEHLEYVVHLLSSYENYKLVITSAPFPFILGVVEIMSSPTPELFTLFYRQFQKGSGMDRTCFALNDHLTTQSVQKNIIGTILEHPSTINGRKGVINEITAILNHLKVHGPRKQVANS